MSTDTSSKVETLEKIFNNVNNWLHFAEAKNAALVAFNIATISAISEFDFLKSINVLFYSMLISILVSTFISLASFSPIVNKLALKKEFSGPPNLLLFSYIASLSNSDEYLKELYEKYWNAPETNATQIEKDFCFEIHTNSKIAIRKYSYFKASVIIDIIICIIWLVLLIVA